METIDAAHAFATLGHPGRLAVFRLLMRFAPQAVRPADIARALGLKANTLSHHLADLVAAGLAQVDRRGRGRFYSVRLDRTEALLGYLALDVGRARPDLLGGLASAARAAPPPQDGHGWNVLFLCSGNSARSLLAEALLRDLGRGRFAAHSAGTRPGPGPHPHALEVLARNGHDIAGLRPKDLAQFRRPGARP